MPIPVAAPVVPTYLEFATAAGDGLALPQVASGASLLRDYLNILAFFFAKPGADRSAAGVAQAFANLPALMMHDSSQGRSVYAWAPNIPVGAAEKMADTLVEAWAGLSSTAALLPLTESIVAGLEPDVSPDKPGATVGSKGGTSAMTRVLVVLHRPDGVAPTLGFTVLNLSVEAISSGSGTHQPPRREIAMTWTKNEFVLCCEPLDEARGFAQQLIRSSDIGDVGLRSDYLAIPVH
jgi:hypothetical protein